MPRPKLIDKNGRFLIPVVYRLRTDEGEPWAPGSVAAGEQPPTCDHCGGLLRLTPQPDLANDDGEFLLPVKLDTREQRPFAFEGIAWDAQDGGGPGKTLTIDVQRGTLKSGDYSLVGYEQRVAVERKSLADLYGTIGQGRDRFERELIRLSAMEFAAVVIEATWPELCSEPPEHTKLPPKIVYRSLLAWTVRYPTVHWIPAGPRRLAEVTTFRLLERFVKEDMTRAKHEEPSAPDRRTE